MHCLSFFPNLSLLNTSILNISEFKDCIGILNFSSHIGFKVFSIFLLLAVILVFNIVNKQYGSLRPFESAEGRFEASIKCKFICHSSLGGN